MNTIRSLKHLSRYGANTSFIRPTSMIYPYHHQVSRFSAPINSDDDNIGSPVAEKPSYSNSIQETLKNKMKINQSTISSPNNDNIKPSTIWSYVAVNDAHKDWIDEYNKSITNYKPFKIDEVDDITAYYGHLKTNIMDKYNRWRMRNYSKLNIVSYDEFMCGAMDSFINLKTVLCSKKKSKSKIIKEIFTPALHDKLKDIKIALFGTNGNKYVIQEFSPFINKCVIYPADDESNLKMVFRLFVRYYYSLKHIEKEDIIHKHADFEWICEYNAAYKQSESDSEEPTQGYWELNDKGFAINRVDVCNHSVKE